MRDNATLGKLMEAYDAREKKARVLRQNGKNWLLERESGELLAEHVTKDEKNGNLIIRVYKDGFVYFEESDYSGRSAHALKLVQRTGIAV